MTPEERITRRLIVEIENELDHLAALREEAAAAPRDDVTYNLRARGSILHDFYSGIERVFRRIADEVDGGVPQGEQWHRQLVTDMTLEIPGVRRALITADLAARLQEYLAFRHVFRNVYGYLMDAERIRALEGRLPETLDTFGEQVRAFLGWMAGSDDR